MYSFGLSQIDYYNSFFIGLPSRRDKQLQSLRNSVAGRSIFKALKILSPSYISDLSSSTVLVFCHCVQPHWTTCLKPISFTNSHGDRAFEIIATHLWNKLPSDIRSPSSVEKLKTKLKYFLFNDYFNSDIKLMLW